MGWSLGKYNHIAVVCLPSVGRGHFAWFTRNVGPPRPRHPAPATAPWVGGDGSVDNVIMFVNDENGDVVEGEGQMTKAVRAALRDTHRWLRCSVTPPETILNSLCWRRRRCRGWPAAVEHELPGMTPPRYTVDRSRNCRPSVRSDRPAKNGSGLNCATRSCERRRLDYCGDVAPRERISDV